MITNSASYFQAGLALVGGRSRPLIVRFLLVQPQWGKSADKFVPPKKGSEKEQNLGILPECDLCVGVGDKRRPRHRPSGPAARRLEGGDRRPWGDDRKRDDNQADDNEDGVHDFLLEIMLSLKQKGQPSAPFYVT